MIALCPKCQHELEKDGCPNCGWGKQERLYTYPEFLKEFFPNINPDEIDETDEPTVVPSPRKPFWVEIAERQSTK